MNTLTGPGDSDSQGGIAQPATFEGLPHPVSVLVWGLRSTVVAGEKFTVVLALRCGCRCPMAGQTVAIVDHLGRRIHETTMSGDLWPGSEAVYTMEVPLMAPVQEGRFTWQVSVIASDVGVAHGGMAELELQVTRPPECTATVTAIDADDRTPLARATVSMHPFRTLSDEKGMAQLQVLKGEYRLLVSAANHAAVSRCINMTDDYSTTVELARVATQNPYAYWDSAV